MRLECRVNDLCAFPQKFALVDDVVLTSWGIRFTVIENYPAFYLIDEQTRTIYVVRFLYGKSDWASVLRQGFPGE